VDMRRWRLRMCYSTRSVSQLIRLFNGSEGNTNKAIEFQTQQGGKLVARIADNGGIRMDFPMHKLCAIDIPNSKSLARKQHFPIEDHPDVIKQLVKVCSSVVKVHFEKTARSCAR
jgi:hypothetical protein